MWPLDFCQGRQALTALDAYQRLEASGVWRPGPSEQRLNVVVSLGSASLTITDLKDSALAHWSLPAVERVNPGNEPAIYRAALDADDRLEISDPEMIAAIEQVRRAVGKGRPKPGRLRNVILGGAVLGAAALVALWAPNAIRDQAAMILPQASHEALGNELFGKVKRIAGSPCSDRQGQAALDRLAAKVAPGARVWVMPSGLEATAVLPNNIILLGRSVVEDHDSMYVPSGYLVEAYLFGRERDPIAELLADASVYESGRLLTTGKLADRALQAHAERRLQEPGPSPDQTALAAEFGDLGLPAEPYAFAKDISGESMLPLIEASEVTIGEATPPLSDSDWVALQGICGE